MNDNYRLLLSEAARLYEKHEAGRLEPFNVFSVLRSQHDEVNLHSRFLHALLDYRQSPDNPRKNLADFLRSVVHIDNLDPHHATVERESGNIDILIRDRSSRRAVVIENKIWAGDQPEQLRRYAEQLERESYTPYLLYLTLDGHPPSEDSAGGLEYECISYEVDLPPWLKRCQKRAYDEPALRESVAQYLRLIAKLTGTDYSEAYMNDLKELCQKENNFVLVHDLNKAMIEARVSLLQKLWQEIACKLREEISDLPEQSEDSNISESMIRGFVTRHRGCKDHGLYYMFRDCASLSVVVEDSIFFGVRCSQKDNEDEYNRLKEKLGGDGRYPFWPWWQYAPSFENRNLRDPTQKEDLKLLANLANKEKRQKYVEELVSGVRELWERVKDAGFA